MTQRTLSLYMLKQEVRRPEDALARPIRTSYVVQGLTNARLFLKRTRKDEPEWLAFLRPHLDHAPSRRATASLSALLIFQVDSRWFALAFGYGRALLDPGIAVSNFGLRVAINSVDPDALRSIDAKTLEELTVLTRRQLSRGSSITTFELDLNRDLVKSVRGRSMDTTFADQVSGSDALRLTSNIAFGDIEPRTRKAFELFNSKSYRDRFAWIDHVRPVSDPAEKTRLDQKLERVIAANAAGTIYLAAPSILDEDDFGGFQYLNRGTDVVFDLRWEDYLNLKQGTPSLAALRRDRIGEISAASSDVIRQWRVYNGLVVELDIGDTRYVLSGGEWFGVDRTYARETRRLVEQYESTSLRLPAARLDEWEGAYNERVCQTLGDSARLMDRQPFRATESQDPIEFCDILLSTKKIIHVKRKSGSSTLSHLFNQGSVSGELLQADEGFRTEVRKSLASDPVFSGIIPARDLQPSLYEIAYAIMAPPPRGNRHFLPFFSQVSFRRAAEHLSARGYEVSLTRVDVQ
jgi:uncharacterized protein (TIGR04141 family)